MTDLLNGESTVAIRSGLGRRDGLRADFLLRSCYAPMLSPAVIARHGMPRTSADLRELPLIDPGDPGWAVWFEAAARGAGVTGIQILAAQAMFAGRVRLC